MAHSIKILHLDGSEEPGNYANIMACLKDCLEDEIHGTIVLEGSPIPFTLGKEGIFFGDHLTSDQLNLIVYGDKEKGYCTPFAGVSKEVGLSILSKEGLAASQSYRAKVVPTNCGDHVYLILDPDYKVKIHE